jgi:hypothetical protein
MLSVVMMSVVMLNVIMLSVVMLSVFMLRVNMLNIIMLRVVMLNIVILNIIMVNVIMLGVIMLSVVALLPVAGFKLSTLGFRVECSTCVPVGTVKIKLDLDFQQTGLYRQKINRELAPGAIFTTLYFLQNFGTFPIS